MKKVLLVLIYLGTTVGCAGGLTMKEKAPDTVSERTRVREFKVTDWSHEEMPDWAKLAAGAAEDLESLKDANRFRYFVAESDTQGLLDRELACADAMLDVNRVIAEEIENTVSASSGAGKKQENSDLNRNIETSKRTEVSGLNLLGLEKRSVYWEKRDYSQIGQSKPSYYCKVLVRMSKDSFEKSSSAWIKSKQNNKVN